MIVLVFFSEERVEGAGGGGKLPFVGQVGVMLGDDIRPLEQRVGLEVASFCEGNETRKRSLLPRLTRAKVDILKNTTCDASHVRCGACEREFRTRADTKLQVHK